MLAYSLKKGFGFTDDDDEMDRLRKFEEWFEGFEKQEQDKNEKAKKQIKGGFRFTDTKNQSYWRGYLQRGKEILGDEKKEESE